MVTAEELNVIENYEYRTQEVMLVPYAKATRAHLPEDLLVSLYCRTRDERLMETAFPGIQMDLVGFIQFMGARAVQILCVRDEDGVLKLAGYGLIVQAEGVDGARTARFGFNFFRQWHGTRQARDLGMFLIAFWMKELRVDVLYGTTLKSNRLAQNFGRRRFGFRVLCDLPKFFSCDGRLTDGTLVVLEKQDFMEYYTAWRAQRAQFA